MMNRLFASALAVAATLALTTGATSTATAQPVFAGGTASASGANSAPHSARDVRVASDEYPTFKSLDGGLCLDVNMVDNSTQTWVPLTVWDCNFNDNQRFANTIPGGVSCCQLINQASQKCMDAGGGGQPFNGQDVGVFPCKLSTPENQDFRFQDPPPDTLGYSEIRAQGKCVEIRVDPNDPFAQPGLGTKIQLWDCNGQPWQKWKLFTLSSQ